VCAFVHKRVSVCVGLMYQDAMFDAFPLNLNRSVQGQLRIRTQQHEEYSIEAERDYGKL